MLGHPVPAEITTLYFLTGRPGLGSQQEPPRPDRIWGSTILLFNGYWWGFLCQVLKLPDRKADHTLPSNFDVQNAWNPISMPPIRRLTSVLKHMGNFPLLLTSRLQVHNFNAAPTCWVISLTQDANQKPSHGVLMRQYPSLFVSTWRTSGTFPWKQKRLISSSYLFT